MQSCAHSETLLLQAYNVSPPPRCTGSEPPGIRDSVATGVLQLYHPCLLLSSIPLSVAGDGNCLFRALSRGLYGSEDHHIHLRLLTTLEIATHREWYDIASPAYKGLLNDQRIVCDTYPGLLGSVCKRGQYSETMTIYAASAAIGLPIESYCPPTRHARLLSDPLTCIIRGRGVSDTAAAAVTVMWTTTTVPRSVKDPFVPNHFVVLHDHQPDTIAVASAHPVHSTPLRVNCSYQRQSLGISSVDDRQPHTVSDLDQTAPANNPDCPEVSVHDRQPHTVSDLDQTAPANKPDCPEVSEVSVQPHDKAVGGFDLPLGPAQKPRFLGVQEVVNILLTHAVHLISHSMSLAVPRRTSILL